MSSVFPRTLRALGAEPTTGRRLLLGAVLLLSGAWGAWFLFARLPIVVTSERARVAMGATDTPAGVVAWFAPVSFLARVKAGQSARVRCETDTSPHGGATAATVTTVHPDLDAGSVRVDLVLSTEASGRSLLDVPCLVEIAVDHGSPAWLVIEAAGRRGRRSASEGESAL